MKSIESVVLTSVRAITRNRLVWLNTFKCVNFCGQVSEKIWTMKESRIPQKILYHFTVVKNIFPSRKKWRSKIIQYFLFCFSIYFQTIYKFGWNISSNKTIFDCMLKVRKSNGIFYLSWMGPSARSIVSQFARIAFRVENKSSCGARFTPRTINGTMNPPPTVRWKPSVHRLFTFIVVANRSQIGLNFIVTAWRIRRLFSFNWDPDKLRSFKFDRDNDPNIWRQSKVCEKNESLEIWIFEARASSKGALSYEKPLFYSIEKIDQLTCEPDKVGHLVRICHRFGHLKRSCLTILTEAIDWKIGMYLNSCTGEAITLCYS